MLAMPRLLCGEPPRILYRVLRVFPDVRASLARVLRAPSQQGQVHMLDADARCRTIAATPSADVGTSTEEPTSHTICDLMLSVLSRDNTSRSVYVRRRWQGLGGPSRSLANRPDRK